jgi:hypothetical protein
MLPRAFHKVAAVTIIGTSAIIGTELLAPYVNDNAVAIEAARLKTEGHTITPERIANIMNRPSFLKEVSSNLTDIAERGATFKDVISQKKD